MDKRCLNCRWGNTGWCRNFLSPKYKNKYAIGDSCNAWDHPITLRKLTKNYSKGNRIILKINNVQVYDGPLSNVKKKYLDMNVLDECPYENATEFYLERKENDKD